MTNRELELKLFYKNHGEPIKNCSPSMQKSIKKAFGLTDEFIKKHNKEIVIIKTHIKGTEITIELCFMGRSKLIRFFTGTSNAIRRLPAPIMDVMLEKLGVSKTTIALFRNAIYCEDKNGNKLSNSQYQTLHNRTCKRINNMFDKMKVPITIATLLTTSDNQDVDCIMHMENGKYILVTREEILNYIKKNSSIKNGLIRSGFLNVQNYKKGDTSKKQGNAFIQFKVHKLRDVLSAIDEFQDDDIISANIGEVVELLVKPKMCLLQTVPAITGPDNKVVYRDTSYVETKVSKNDTVGYLNNKDGTISIFLNGALTDKITYKDCEKTIEYLENLIENKTNGNLKIPCHAIKSICPTRKIKAPSTIIEDLAIKSPPPKQSLNVKSLYGSSPTVLTPDAACIVYEVQNLNKTDISNINKINTKAKYVDRVSEIYKLGGILSNPSCINDNFRKNLSTVDVELPQKVAELLSWSYQNGVKNCKECIDNINNQHHDATYCNAFEEFLFSVAIGEMTATKRIPLSECNNGYLVYNKDKTMVIIDSDSKKFRDDVLTKTFFDSPHLHHIELGTIYEKNGKYYINFAVHLRYRMNGVAV